MPEEDLSKLRIDPTVKSFRPSRRRRVFLVGFIFLLAAAAGVLYWQGYLTPAVSVESATVSQVYPSQVLSELTASGYVVAQRRAAVASKVTGRLVELKVEEGNRVKEGEVIARLESQDVLAAREQAEANLKVSQANLREVQAELEEATKAFRRTRELVAKDYVARAEFDAAEARYKRALASVSAARASINASQAGLEAADVALDYTLIRAPFDAVVLTKNADIGDIVTPIGAAANAKAAVVTIADMGSLQVEADVSETNLRLVRVDQPCEIRLDALPDSRFAGVVHMVVPTADRTKATVLVKVSFREKDPRILPEMRAKVAFLSRALKPEEQAPRTAVSAAALVEGAEEGAVFRILENRAVRTKIRLGEKLGGLVEVLEGVKAGDRVVVRPPPGLKDGAKIKVAEK